MSIGAIGGSTPYTSPQVAGRPQETEETTVTINCKKPECQERRSHDRSCSNTVSTKPAPKVGEKGYFFDKTV